MEMAISFLTLHSYNKSRSFIMSRKEVAEVELRLSFYIPLRTIVTSLKKVVTIGWPDHNKTNY